MKTIRLLIAALRYALMKRAYRKRHLGEPGGREERLICTFAGKSKTA